MESAKTIASAFSISPRWDNLSVRSGLLENDQPKEKIQKLFSFLHKRRQMCLNSVVKPPMHTPGVLQQFLPFSQFLAHAITSYQLCCQWHHIAFTCKKRNATSFFAFLQGMASYCHLSHLVKAITHLKIKLHFLS